VILCAVVLVSAWWQCGQFPALMSFIGADARRLLSKTLFFVGGQPIRVLFVIKTVLFLTFLSLVAWLSRRLIRQMAGQHPTVGSISSTSFRVSSLF
jgi:hypothetical protein